MKTSSSLNGSMRKWEPYSAYKDSGLSTSVQIPGHWSMMRLKHVAAVRPSNVDKKTVEGQEPVRLCNYVDVYKNDYITEAFDFMQASATPAQIAAFTLKASDVIITKDSETWDDIAVPAYVKTDLPGVLCGYHLALVRPEPGKVNGEYLFRSFSAEGICDQFRVAANGIIRFGLDTTSIGSSLFPLPPLDEQRRIVAFLNRETAKIDAMITKKERLIELLQEKRTALISHAVTKGLDPTVPMKDSGLPGLKAIPARWGRVCAKRVILFITSGSRGWAEYYADDGDLFIQSGNLDRKLGLDLSVVRRVVPPEGAEVARTRVLKNDVLVCVTGAYTGNVAVVEVDLPKAYVNQHVALLRPKLSVVRPRFLAYSLSSYGAWHFRVSQYGGTKQGLGLADVLSAPIFLPTLDEQAAIVQYLDDETCKIDRLVVEISKAITNLREYRTALISAAVTGKIDVREEV